MTLRYSEQEMDRLLTIKQVNDGMMRQLDAAEVLGLSVRQVRRQRVRAVLAGLDLVS